MCTIKCLLRINEINHQWSFEIGGTALLSSSVWKSALHMNIFGENLLVSQIFESTVAESLLRRNIQKTLLWTDRTVILLQFPHSARFPFLGNLMMMPFHHSSGTASICQHLFMRIVNYSTTVSSSHFISSDVIWSRLMACFFRAFITSYMSLVSIHICLLLLFHPDLGSGLWESPPC